MRQKIVIGSDHGGFGLKEIIVTELKRDGVEVYDLGCFNTTSVHYPEIGRQVAQKVADGEYPRGILICGTGIGMSIIANRINRVRATLCHDQLTAKLSREHNNSNILVLGGRILGIETAKAILEVWLKTDFIGGHHQQRLDMIENYSLSSN